MGQENIRGGVLRMKGLGDLRQDDRELWKTSVFMAAQFQLP